MVVTSDSVMIKGRVGVLTCGKEGEINDDHVRIEVL